MFLLRARCRPRTRWLATLAAAHSVLPHDMVGSSSCNDGAARADSRLANLSRVAICAPRPVVCVVLAEDLGDVLASHWAYARALLVDNNRLLALRDLALALHEVVERATD